MYRLLDLGLSNFLFLSSSDGWDGLGVVVFATVVVGVVGVGEVIQRTKEGKKATGFPKSKNAALV